MTSAARSEHSLVIGLYARSGHCWRVVAQLHIYSASNGRCGRQGLHLAATSNQSRIIGHYIKHPVRGAPISGSGTPCPTCPTVVCPVSSLPDAGQHSRLLMKLKGSKRHSGLVIAVEWPCICVLQPQPIQRGKVTGQRGALRLSSV